MRVAVDTKKSHKLIATVIGSLALSVVIVLMIAYTKIDYPLWRAYYKFIEGDQLKIGDVTLKLPPEFYFPPNGKSSELIIIGAYYDKNQFMPSESSLNVYLAPRIKNFSIQNLRAYCKNWDCVSFSTKTVGGVTCGVMEDAKPVGHIEYMVICAPERSKVVVLYSGTKAHYPFFETFFTKIVDEISAK